MDEDYDIIFKIIIIGDTSVGKTGLLNRYLHNDFSDNTKATVGVDFGAKKLVYNDCKIKLQIWDTAGQERYRSITNAYYKGAKGAIIVYDISKRSSFENVERWISEIKSLGDPNLLLLLIGNKSDLEEKREVSLDEGKQKAINLGIAFMETSAKNSTNVVKAFEEISFKITDSILINQLTENKSQEDIVFDRKVEYSFKNKDQQKTKSSKLKCC